MRNIIKINNEFYDLCKVEYISEIYDRTNVDQKIFYFFDLITNNHKYSIESSFSYHEGSSYLYREYANVAKTKLEAIDKLEQVRQKIVTAWIEGKIANQSTLIFNT